METVCDKMTDYAEKTDPETKEKTYVRYQSRDGEDMELINVSINLTTGKILKVAVSFLPNLFNTSKAIFNSGSSKSVWLVLKKI